MDLKLLLRPHPEVAEPQALDQPDLDSQHPQRPMSQRWHRNQLHQKQAVAEAPYL